MDKINQHVAIVAEHGLKDDNDRLVMCDARHGQVVYPSMQAALDCAVAIADLYGRIVPNNVVGCSHGHWHTDT